MPVIKAGEADTDGDAKEAETTGAMTLMNVVVAAPAAENPEAMEGVQDTEGRIITGMPEGELAEGLMWQVEQCKQEHRQATVEHVTPSANMMEALEDDLDVQEGSGWSIQSQDPSCGQGE